MASTRSGTSYSFVTKAALDNGLADRIETQTLVPVKRCRTISKRDMIHNDALPDIEIDPETYNVYVDGERITVKTGEDLAADPALLLPVGSRSASNPMAVVTAVLGTVESLRGRFESEDPVPLNSEERASAHLVGRSEGGRDVRISLPRGTEINDGDVLALDGATAVVARAAPEALYVVSPEDAYTWGVAGYQLGNLHRPVRFTDEGMLNAGRSHGGRPAHAPRHRLRGADHSLRRPPLWRSRRASSSPPRPPP